MARPLAIQTVPLPVVKPDKPTGRPAPDPVETAPAVKALPATLDEALGSKDRAINNRVPGELWDLVAVRANEIGVNLRPLLTDALVRALESEPQEHRARINETERRQAYARIDRR